MLSTAFNNYEDTAKNEACVVIQWTVISFNKICKNTTQYVSSIDERIASFVTL